MFQAFWYWAGFLQIRATRRKRKSRQCCEAQSSFTKLDQRQHAVDFSDFGISSNLPIHPLFDSEMAKAFIQHHKMMFGQIFSSPDGFAIFQVCLGRKYCKINSSNFPSDEIRWGLCAGTNGNIGFTSGKTDPIGTDIELDGELRISYLELLQDRGKHFAAKGIRGRNNDISLDPLIQAP